MIILVITEDGDERLYPTATRFSTDDFNNLCIYEGGTADRLVHVFAAGKWREAGLDDDES